MTAPEPAYRPHLVGSPEDYPYDDGSPLAQWRDQANAHNARRELADMHRQVEEMRGWAHDAYLAECRRLIERTQAGNAVAASQWPHPAPSGTVPDPVQIEHAQPPGPRGIRWPEDPAPDGVPDEGPEVSGTLRERAAALFKASPTASRATVKAVLGCNEYEAKKLHAAKDEIVAEPR